MYTKQIALACITFAALNCQANSDVEKLRELRALAKEHQRATEHKFSGLKYLTAGAILCPVSFLAAAENTWILNPTLFTKSKACMLLAAHIVSYPLMSYGAYKLGKGYYLTPSKNLEFLDQQEESIFNRLATYEHVSSEDQG